MNLIPSVPQYLVRLGQLRGERVDSTPATLLPTSDPSSPPCHPPSSTVSEISEASPTPFDFSSGSSNSSYTSDASSVYKSTWTVPFALPKPALEEEEEEDNLAGSAGWPVGIERATSGITTRVEHLRDLTDDTESLTLSSSPEEGMTQVDDEEGMPDVEGLEAEEFFPPENFAMVDTFIYRSSFPKKKHFPFLKSLGLKTVLTLVLEDYPEENTKFLEDEGINFFQVGLPGNKQPFVRIPDEKIVFALATIVLDVRNHPLLIHCNKGKHRTGCLVGCLRKLQHWSLPSIIEEYRLFAAAKARSHDQQFIEAFEQRNKVWAKVDARFVPSWGFEKEAGGM